MADQEDVRRIALSLPGASEAKGHFAFSVESKGKPKGFVWVWMERIHPRKARVPNPDVEVSPTVDDLRSGRDVVLVAARQRPLQPQARP